jgi:peptide-methionine (S)-S-oxide reductase
MALVWRREEPATSCTQDVALKNPGNPYIMICDRPKIAALKKEFPELFVSYKGQHNETN